MITFQVLQLLLLLLGLANSQQCNRQIHLWPNQPINITSMNFPNAFPSGSNCRYQLIAPTSHVIRTTCHFEIAPDNCQSIFLYISRDGDLQFRSAERYCRKGQVSSTSNFQRLAIAYQSSGSAQQRGRLRCLAEAKRVPCDCGWSQPTRITNGVEAAKHEFPSMVGLRDISSNLPIFCGGSIISERFIVTAAHCTDRQPVASRLSALIGIHDLRFDRETMFTSQYAIQQIIQHPNYNSIRVTNDIALLKTFMSMVWSRGVAPICLPFGQLPLAETFEVVDIAGWGTLSFGQAKSNTLQKAKVMTITNSDCSAQYNKTIDESQLCTYDHTGMGQDSCQYDSGGPVVLRQRSRMFLLGVISYGRSCGRSYGIGINTRISSHLNWIRSYVGGSVCVR